MKEKMYRIIEKGSHGKKGNLFFDYLIMSLILLSIISIILESITEVSFKYGSILRIFNTFSIIIFSIEYLIRAYVSKLTHPSSSNSKSFLKFVISPYAIIDLLAILPFYLPLLFKLDLRFLRVLRLTRFFRILKVNRYNNSLNLIWSVIKEKKPELLITGFVAFIILIIASFLMYHIEGQHQPEKFPNILESFWWAIATLTTVGYGDVYPVSGFGKIISGIIALLGIGLVALPTGLISAGFMNKIEDKEKKCPHCNKNI